jgi:hypothetical protein
VQTVALELKQILFVILDEHLVGLLVLSRTNLDREREKQGVTCANNDIHVHVVHCRRVDILS